MFLIWFLNKIICCLSLNVHAGTVNKTHYNLMNLLKFSPSTILTEQIAISQLGEYNEYFSGKKFKMNNNSLGMCLNNCRATTSRISFLNLTNIYFCWQINAVLK